MTDAADIILKEIDIFMDDYVDRVFELSQENLIRDGKIDTGAILTTANVIREPFVKTIVYPVNYADVIEWGRDPGFPVYSVWLHDWVRRKLGISNDKEVKRVAFAIARAIEDRGIEQSPFIRPALEKANQEFKVKTVGV